MLPVPNSRKRTLPALVSVSGASGKTSPHSTKPLPSGRKARTKKEQLSPRKPLQALFFFVPELETALADKDAETAFRAAHTLKGICLNLGFDNLFAPSQELTEKLRGATTIEGTDELFAAVEKEYDRTCEALRKIA